MLIKKALCLAALCMAFNLSASSCENSEDSVAVAEPVPTSLVGKKVAILGDSYSTFDGWCPEGYAIWYKEGRNTDVKLVEQTWWKLLIDECNCDLLINSSYSGSTICNTGYNQSDATASSFITRMQKDLPDDVEVLFVFGGTNDSWAMSPVGEFKYSDWTTEDLYEFRPATCFMLDFLTKKFPNTTILTIINSGLSPEVTEGLAEISSHYGVEHLQLENIDKQNGHPSIGGMASIKEQIYKHFNK